MTAVGNKLTPIKALIKVVFPRLNWPNTTSWGCLIKRDYFQSFLCPYTKKTSTDKVEAINWFYSLKRASSLYFYFIIFTLLIR